jgi:multiple sugar transport system permease protein
LLLLVLVGYALAQGFWKSLHASMIGMANPPFIGLNNYIRNLRDDLFRLAVYNTMVYTIFSTLARLLLGLGTALLLNRGFKGRGLVRGLVILPWALPAIATVLGWAWIFNGSWGVLNAILRALGLIKVNIAWLSNPRLAMPAVITVNVWRGFPFFAMTLLAGLQGIPQELYDAAAVDGAGQWRQFRHVTLPGLRSVIYVVTLLGTLWSLNDFIIAWALTKGGPSYHTEVLSIYIFRTAFVGQELGRAMAASLLLVPIMMVLVYLLVRSLSRA